jgi:hypothetical protein
MTRAVCVAAAIAAGAVAGCGSPSAAVERESAARDAFIRRLAEKEGMQDAWSLITRNDVRFEDGFSVLVFERPNDFNLEWYSVCEGCVPVRGTGIKWMNRRAHLRLRGTTDMRLELEGRVAVDTVFTRPRVGVTVDGTVLDSVVVAPDGRFRFSGVVPASALDGWVDAYITISSVSEPWREPGDLRAAALEHLRWEPVAGSTAAGSTAAP